MWRSALTCLGLITTTVCVAGSARAATPPPFRALGSFDRIAVSFSADRSVFVTTRDDSTHDATDLFLGPTTANTGRFPNELAWSNGAGALAVVEQASGGYRLRVVEYPNGVNHDLTAKVEALREGQVGTRFIFAARWVTPSAAKVLVSAPPIGVVRLAPDGSGGTVLDTHPPQQIDQAMFADGHHAIVAKVNSTDNAGFVYTDLFKRDLTTGVDTQLTNTPFISERSPALSPDETKVAYVREPELEHQPVHGQTLIGIVGTDGSNNTLVTPNTNLYYEEPAWRPDGSRIAFIGLMAPESSNNIVGRPILYSMKPDGSDLVRHTPDTNFGNPYPAPMNINSIRPADVAWGATCVGVLQCSAQISPAPSGQLQANPSIGLSGASVGFLVERYHGHKLKPVGRVPFGPQRKGKAHLKWDVAIDGKPLPRGRYRITLRVLAAGKDPIPVELSRPVDLIVKRHHELKLAPPRVRN